MGKKNKAALRQPPKYCACPKYRLHLECYKAGKMANLEGHQQINLKTRMLNKKSKLQKNKCSVTPFTLSLNIRKTTPYVILVYSSPSLSTGNTYSPGPPVGA